MKSLAGSFLIATPMMPDPRFARQVVLVCAHNQEEGAMGVVVNHPSRHNLAEILDGAGIPVSHDRLPAVHYGGPVEMESAFILFSSDYDSGHYLEVTPAMRISRDVKLLHDIARGEGPERYLFLVGYSGWAPGQLEQELTMSGWLVLPASEEVVFSTPDEMKWEKAAALHGIDIQTFGDVVGTA